MKGGATQYLELAERARNARATSPEQRKPDASTTAEPPAKIAELAARGRAVSPAVPEQPKPARRLPQTEEEVRAEKLQAIARRCKALPPPPPPCALCQEPTVLWSDKGYRGCWTCQIVQNRKGEVIGQTGALDTSIEGYSVAAMMRVDAAGALHITPVDCDGVLGDTYVVAGYIKRKEVA